MKIGKYQFDTKEQADELINVLEKGNSFVRLGYIVLTPPTFNEDGEQLTDAILSDKYSVDVLWQEDESDGWGIYRIDLVGEGVHCFAGLSYQDLKV